MVSIVNSFPTIDLTVPCISALASGWLFLSSSVAVTSVEIVSVHEAQHAVRIRIQERAMRDGMIFVIHKTIKNKCAFCTLEVNTKDIYFYFKNPLFLLSNICNILIIYKILKC